MLKMAEFDKHRVLRLIGDLLEYRVMAMLGIVTCPMVTVIDNMPSHKQHTS
jgi:hypothetical protein